MGVEDFEIVNGKVMDYKVRLVIKMYETLEEVLYEA